MRYIFLMVELLALSFFYPVISYSADILAPYVDYATGPHPRSVVTGDFNNDGKLDLVTANDSTAVSVLLGNGDGTFKSKKDVASGGFSLAVITGDFNKDGNTDIATANYGSDTASILLGCGDGTFRPHTEYGTGSTPYSIIANDFNGDGKIDIATANLGSGGVSVLFGKGDGTFGSRIDYWTGPYPVSVTTGDFNNDGNADIATSNLWSGFAVSILIGGGDGTFQPTKIYGTGNWPYGITIGDFNTDGKNDIVVASSDINALTLLLGNGDGSFQANRNYRTGFEPRSIAIGDFNGDGKVDVATGNRNGYTVSILLGNGDGTFQTNKDYRSAGAPCSVASGDFNGDGKLDLAAANGGYGQNTVSIFINQSELPPVANGGPDQVIECAGPSGTSVSLDGSGSSDPDGDALTYAWTWNGGSAEGISPTISLPLGTTLVALVVSDGKASATDTVNISTRDTAPPVTTATGGNGNWYNTNVIATFSASDSCSGIKEIHYSIDGSEMVAPGNYASTTITTEGIHNITYYSVDNSGIQESLKSMTVNIDKTAPTVNINAPFDGADYTLGQAVMADWSTNDLLSGIDTATATLPVGSVVDTSTSGAKTFSVTATDRAGNAVTRTSTYYVRYTYGGVSQPINADGSSIFRLGSTVAVKFKLTDVSGSYITSAVARIYLAKITDNVIGTEEEAVSTSAASTGNVFRYDSTDNQYIFNLSTGNMSAGTWQIRIELSDGSSKVAIISIR